MRKIICAAFVSLDGVMQAPGGPDEDPTGGFRFGGWTFHYWDDAMGAAMGELFNNPNEWVSIISERLIDFIRVHISQVGGLTMARKMAAMCEFFGVRTAWHGPGDVSPVGHGFFTLVWLPAPS